MGERGPIGKRSSAQAGHRTKAEKAEVETVEVVAAAPVVVPPPSQHWNPLATEWYVALGESGQARFMEPSDWAGARFVAQAMTNLLGAERFSAVLFSGIWSAMNDLLTTEGARRRVKMEIERKPSSGEVPEGVAVMDDYRSITG